MNTEQSNLLWRAAVHHALGDPARLAVVDALAVGDASPGELGAALGLPSNLLAHHLRILQAAGLVERSRSEADRRRTYLRLVAGPLQALSPPRSRRASRVVFVCTHNSARSQLAAALWRRDSPVPAASAGTRPAARVHPLAVAVGRRHRLSLAHARTAPVDEVVRPADLVVAVCDTAYEQWAAKRGGSLHWSVPDPVPVGTARAFERTYQELAGRVGRLASIVEPSGRPR